jgi:hypothetical protein
MRRCARCIIDDGEIFAETRRIHSEEMNIEGRIPRSGDAEARRFLKVTVNRYNKSKQLEFTARLERTKTGGCDTREMRRQNRFVYTATNTCAEVQKEDDRSNPEAIQNRQWGFTR